MRKEEIKKLFLLCPCILAPLVVATVVFAQQKYPAKGSLRLSESESLWTERFNDCDLRYYVLIPPGFVAHGNRPPSPIHGLLVGLPDTGTTDVVTVDFERFIRVRAEPDSLGFKSLEEVADHVLDYMGKTKSGFSVGAQQPARLDGWPATKLRFQYDGPSGTVVEEELLSLWYGTVYEISLRTTADHYEADAPKFAKTAAGFRFWRNYYCYGTNKNP